MNHENLLPDDVIEAAITHLHMAQVKIMGRLRAFEAVGNKTEFHELRIDKLLLAKNRITDAIQVLHSSPDVADEVQTILPF